MWWLLLIVGVLVLGYIFRVQIMAKVLGQSESRVSRQLNRRKD
ncbi:MAG: hypothetical protein V9F00_16760 [Nocardioides sp.]|jgi:hypothetical protein